MISACEGEYFSCAMYSGHDASLDKFMACVSKTGLSPTGAKKNRSLFSEFSLTVKQFSFSFSRFLLLYLFLILFLSNKDY